MSISDNSSAKRIVLWYLGISAFCGAFAALYEQFSHGVISLFMVLLFLFPLIGGALPFSLFLPGKQPLPTPLARKLWHCGVATLTTGSCLTGIFAIYGTRVPLLCLYWIVGAVFVTAGLIVFLFRRSRSLSR